MYLLSDGFVALTKYLNGGLMRRLLILLVIMCTFASSAVCLGQTESETPIDSSESAVEVVPEEVQLPAELEKQLNRLFDPNEVFASEALFKILEEHVKVSPMKAARISSLDARRDQQAPDIGREIHNRLIEGLASEHLEIRRRAALALNSLGDKSGVEVMIADMETADANDKYKIAEALRTIRDRRAIPTLIEAVDDPPIHVRITVIKALGELNASEAFDAIAPHVTDTELDNRPDNPSSPAISACQALARLGERKAIPLLLKVVDNKVAGFAAREALEKLTGMKFDDPNEWKEWWLVENIDGKDLTFRVYNNWEVEPGTFQKVSLKADGRKIKLESNDIKKSAIVAILAEDQNDIAIKKALGNRVYAPLDKNMVFQVPHYNPDAQKESRWFIDDALGNPISDATVEIYLYDYKGPKIKIAEVITDGSFKRLTPQKSMRQFEFIVSHPDYGIAKVPEPYHNKSHITFPLVSFGSEAGNRAIWGVILDPENNPIEGAIIHTRNVRTLGEGLINPNDERCRVISDENGFFNMYMPPSTQYQDQRGELIPPKSRYQVRIEAPKEMRLLPYVGEIENGMETTVVMESAGHFHTFIFVDEYGVIDDPAGLEKVNLIIDRGDKGRLTLGYSDWKERELFPNGIYTAELSSSWRPGTNHGRIKFEAVEITDDSPEEIVLKLPDSVTYFGRVVHGITGEPFAGAYVITMESIGPRKLEDITADQWSAIHELGDNVSVNDPAVGPIKKAYSCGEIVRTDMDGYYTIVTRPGKNFYTFLAFEENFIPVSKRMYAQKPGSSTEVTVPTLKLYAAGKILLEARVDEKHVAIWPKWIFDKSTSPPWIDDLLQIGDGRTSFVRYRGWIKENEPHHVFVPATATLRLQLLMPYDEKWSPFTTEKSFTLGHGEVLDIGRIELKPSLKVYVKIVGPAGEPVEGVPVRKLVGNTGSVAHTTDENGLVMFYLPPYSQGKFYVSYYGQGEEGRIRLKEEIPYQILGEEDNDSEFVLGLSDELLYHLFK
jgi:hypothetical protein